MLILVTVQSYAALENQTCKACHPVIFAEYRSSTHAKSSIFKDALHKAVWDRHPAKKKGTYTCAECHTPADHDLIAQKAMPTNNQIQLTEPISCKACHTIESIESHAKSNKNIYNGKDKTFFAADKELKGTKVQYKEESSFFGMFVKKSGTPYHDIDYSNEGYYNGDSCMGCHSHKQNGKGLLICDLEIKQGDSKESCISCHMPQKQGSLANQKQSATHTFHGQNIHQATPAHLSKYVKLSIKKSADGFEISIKNEATHTLFPQSFRLNQLRVSIDRGGKSIALDVKSFARIIGTNGEQAMPWLADSVVSDNSIKALETRTVEYKTALQKGDSVVAQFGYYMVNPKEAKELELTDHKELTEFIILTKKRFDIE